jgi:hypothetical protein
MKLLLALILSLSATIAQASVVTYSFSGLFAAPSRSAFIPGSVEPVMQDLVSAGDRFTGSFTFDTEAAPIEKDDNPWALYSLLNFELQASERFNAIAGTWTPEWIQVTDDKQWDMDELIVAANVQLDPSHALQVVMRMSPTRSDAFDGFRVPDGFNDFASASLSLTLFHFDEFMRDDTWSAVDIALDGAPTAVPEPATGMLLLAGLAGLTVRRRRC